MNNSCECQRPRRRLFGCFRRRQCLYPGCLQSVFNGGNFCHNHECREDSCENPIVARGNFCDYHTCHYGDCKNRAKQYVKLLDDGEKVRITFLYCVAHNCQMAGCGNFSKEELATCLSHKVSAGGSCNCNCSNNPMPEDFNLDNVFEPRPNSLGNSYGALPPQIPNLENLEDDKVDLMVADSSENDGEGLEVKEENNEPDVDGNKGCHQCVACTNCSSCVSCKNLNSCKKMLRCHDSVRSCNSQDSSKLEDCNKMINCHGCKNSSNCRNSTDLSDCHECD